MRRPLAALLLAGTLLTGPALAASEDFRPELERLIERAERTDAADSAFLDDLRELTGTSYSSYGQEPDLEALEALIERAERTNAADESFLADLRELADSYGETQTGYGGGSTYSDDDDEDDQERTQRRALIEDEFSDGDYTQDPRWTVTAGEFSVESEGLRSRVREQQASSENAGEAIAGALLGALTGAGTPRAYAAIHNGTDVPNAFAVELAITSQGEGRFDFGPYQGSGDTGYRIAFTPGASPSVQLLKARQDGVAVIDSWEGDLGRSVEFQWTRDEDGEMTVSANGETLFEVSDRSFRDPFQGFLMLNGGGDFTVERVAVSG
jgi:hypothetical protein